MEKTIFPNITIEYHLDKTKFSQLEWKKMKDLIIDVVDKNIEWLKKRWITLLFLKQYKKTHLNKKHLLVWKNGEYVLLIWDKK